MNAALLVMSSALAVGGDVVPAGGIVPAGGFGDAPIVAAPGPGCAGCGPVVNAGGCCKGSFFDKLKGRFAPKPSCGCECHKPGLFDRLKGLGKKHHCGCETAPCAIAAPAPPPVPPTTTSPPKDMPKTTPPKTGAIVTPIAPTAPAAIIVPSAPALPIVPIAPIPSASKTSVPSPY